MFNKELAHACWHPSSQSVLNVATRALSNIISRDHKQQYKTVPRKGGGSQQGMQSEECYQVFGEKLEVEA